MTPLQKRLARLDKKTRMIIPKDPVFFSWKGDPWTPEQEALAIRRYPNGKRFWRPLFPDEAKDQVIRCDVWPDDPPVTDER